ncbi:toll/interleukin-1 receptor domain-containing protein [Dehalobacterium formicoaceticum]|uniref:toll/interleukin-1 receptor domain-containing protein n=1 Tax=Dehalobacterium formicoaceticum TaxID=51515 RepID=UPI000B7FB302|nr:toll/interleukin-1 receptor domain-containing protein [Dehalobacterium formicoaceticum]
MKVFLSHSSVNKDLVKLVHQKLSDKNTWFDAVDILNGEKIPDKINDGINNATHFVLFWSKHAADSNWVKAELNAAFVKMMSDKCKFMIFMLDRTELPALLQPYKYDTIDSSDLDGASTKICEIVLSQESNVSSLNSFVNRTKEIGDIEATTRAGYKLIILNGILGIGKSSLAKRANEWIYGQYNSSIVIDFDRIPGMGELVIALSKLTNQSIPYENITLKLQKDNLRFFLEFISSKNIFVIMKDIKGWLTEDGEPNSDLYFIIDLIVNTKMFATMPVIMTSSRYVDLSYQFKDSIRQLRITGMEDSFISSIIKNNLSISFDGYDVEKNLEFAKSMCGYPLGAKLGAFLVSNFGYNYYLKQPNKVNELKIGLAKQLIAYAKISDECISFMEIIALVQSRLRNVEYVEVFTEYTASQISNFTNEAFFAGILKIDDEGCYKLEHIVEDYYNDLAFNSSKRNERCNELESYIIAKMRYYESDISNYFRLLPVAIRILALNGKVKDAVRLRSEMICTIIQAMWDQYNHREYDDAFRTANDILEISDKCLDALYIKALCYIRFEKYLEATKLIKDLILCDSENPRYYNSLGRIEKYQERYESALQYFRTALQKKQRYISSYREMAECYLYLGDVQQARNNINKAKDIDDTNIFVILLECRILQKEGRGQEALELISSETVLNEEPSQIMFRRGRIHDEIGETDTAIECYESALQYNSRQIDAQLCLLNYKISHGVDCTKIIDKLEKTLRGKRKFILTNIKARYIGYYGNDLDGALDLLQTVPSKYIDKQWYAVKIQLLEKLHQKHISADRLQLADMIYKEMDSVKSEFKKKYNEDKVSDASLLPDA